MKKVLLYTIIGLLLVTSVFSFYSYSRIQGGKWVCIAQTCNEWLTGDDWISHNCRPDESNQLKCKMVINEKEYNAPLDIINISRVKSCMDYSCVTEVYVKETKVIE